jgi:hypothetical protein
MIQQSLGTHYRSLKAAASRRIEATLQDVVLFNK